LISAILLAAGESTRMGRTKQLLSFGESTIFGETVKNLLAAEIDELIIVLGHDAEKLKNSLTSSDPRITYVVNRQYREGISTSIKCGITSTNPETEAFLFALADQPLIRTEIMNLLIRRYTSGSTGIVTLAYRSARGHPVIISRKYQGDLLSLSGDVGARKILESHTDDVEIVEIDSPEILFDVDREEDYARLKNTTVNHSGGS
jgi:molybdenum cofactor cytidylyltransferase